MKCFPGELTEFKSNAMRVHDKTGKRKFFEDVYNVVSYRQYIHSHNGFVSYSVHVCDTIRFQ